MVAEVGVTRPYHTPRKTGQERKTAMAIEGDSPPASLWAVQPGFYLSLLYLLLSFGPFQWATGKIASGLGQSQSQLLTSGSKGARIGRK